MAHADKKRIFEFIDRMANRTDTNGIMSMSMKDIFIKYNKNKGNIMLWVSPYESDGDIEVPVYRA